MQIMITGEKVLCFQLGINIMFNQFQIDSSPR